MPRSLITAVRNPINPDITSLLSAVRVAMVQTGYYTIKELLDTKDKASHPKYLMTVPNREIEADLRENVLTKLNGFLADELKALDGD